MAETADIFNMLKPQGRRPGLRQLLGELRALALDPKTRDNVITLETLAYFTERLVEEFAPLEAIVPNAIDAIEVNDEPVEMEGRTAKIEVPTRVSQLEDAGSYLHIKALKDELAGYVQRGELPETVLTQDEKDRLDMLPDLSQRVGPNGVSLNGEGQLEVESLTPDRLYMDGYALLLDCGRPFDTTIEVLQ